MLNHPNIVQVYDLAISSDRRPYIVMQLLDGEPLSRLLAKRIDVKIAVRVARDVLAALEVAHGRGVVHRDLKPENIFVTKGRAVIVDFGLAKLIADPMAPSLTATGAALGTPHYMAPEQVRGELADGRADLYAVGCVLFEMLAGRPPFEESATFAIFDAHLHKQPPSIRDIRSDVPEAVEQTIAHALAKEAGSRFASAGQMLEALGGRRRATAPRAKRRWPLAVLGFLVLGGLVAVGSVVAPATSTEATVVVAPVEEPVVVPPPEAPAPTRRIAVPDALPEELPLDKGVESAIATLHEQLETGRITAKSARMMHCDFVRQDREAIEARGTVPRQVRGMHRRLTILLEAYLPGTTQARCR
jgi:serine/threonine-protein kinase